MVRVRGTAAETTPALDDLAERTDLLRLEASRRLDPARRSDLGQYLTPSSVARWMAGMFDAAGPTIRLLDAGAGVGSLSAAFVSEVCGRSVAPQRIEVTAWEIDEALARPLRETVEACRGICDRRGVGFTGSVRVEDFIAAGVAMIDRGLFAGPRRTFHCAILNPPYRKIRADSDTRRLLRSIGLETSNLYAAFLAVAIDLIEPGGELVAITPRSFCNGPYFQPFRERFLSAMSLRRVHVFESRDRAFRDDDVLQETVIVHAVKGGPRTTVVVSSSEGPDDDCPTVREVPADQIVRPDDPQRVIHIVTDDLGRRVSDRMARLGTTLSDLGIQVSTGRVVDFRARAFLSQDPAPGTVPLIYPGHLAGASVVWPRPTGRKPNAIVDGPETVGLLLPSGTYVLTKRFTSKEEPRRIVAAVCDPAVVPGPRVGFENHLNVFHQDGAGLLPGFARGIAAWLNSTVVDTHFRQWSGHTQVNATDLRKMSWPTRAELEALGDLAADPVVTVDDLDRYIERVLFTVSDEASKGDPVRTRKRIADAMDVLKALGLPTEQQNERSALTLLALLDLTADKPWSDAACPLRGITPMMTFFEQQYGKKYAPNTRETVRRFTIHQFVAAGIVLENPDKPDRPTNSPRAVYQIEPSVLALLRTRGTAAWEARLETWLASVETLTVWVADAPGHMIHFNGERFLGPY